MQARVYSVDTITTPVKSTLRPIKQNRAYFSQMDAGWPQTWFSHMDTDKDIHMYFSQMDAGGMGVLSRMEAGGTDVLSRKGQLVCAACVFFVCLFCWQRTQRDWFHREALNDNTGNGVVDIYLYYIKIYI